MKKSQHEYIFFLLVLLSAFFLSSCTSFRSVKLQGGLEAPLYDETSSWLFQELSPQKKLDVFYVYPTIYGDENPTNMDIYNEALRDKAMRSFKKQTGVYTEVGNIFAPFYRQVSMAVLDPSEDTYKNKNFLLGYKDVSRAFEYYLKHLNNGRPFILAGHSQGSMGLITLMREHFESVKLQKQLIAAYLIGYSVTKEDFRQYPWMKPATGESDTGVIVSYNSQAPGAKGSPVILSGAFCINPLNWKTDGTPAAASSNLGAVFFKADGSVDKVVPHYSGATIDIATGALTTVLPEKLDTGGFPKGVYHIYDYSLWFNNLKKNIKLRSENYMKSAK